MDNTISSRESNGQHVLQEEVQRTTRSLGGRSTDNTFSRRKINRQLILQEEEQQTTRSLVGRVTDNTFSSRESNGQHDLQQGEKRTTRSPGEKRNTPFIQVLNLLTIYWHPLYTVVHENYTCPSGNSTWTIKFTTETIDSLQILHNPPSE